MPIAGLLTYPALALFVGIGLGVWLNDVFGGLPAAAWSVPGIVGMTSAVAGIRLSRERFVSLGRLSTIGGAALLAVAVGGMRGAQYATPHATDIVHRLTDTPVEVSLYGRLLSTPVSSSGRARMYLLADSVRGLHEQRLLSVSGGVYLTVRDASDMSRIGEMRAGARIRADGRLQAPLPRRNPADFDFRRYLHLRSVYATIRVDSLSDIELIAPPRGVVRRIAGRVEAHIETAIGVHLPTSTGRGVLLALLLGRRSEIESEVREQFARTGLMHVLAVSGLHVLMVGMIIYGLLCPVLLRFGFRWRTMDIARAVVTLLLLTTYAVVTGGSASVIRAVVMTGVLIGGVSLQRASPAINSLAIAGCVLVLQRPTFIWDIGFQLSFSAVSAIVLLQRPLMMQAEGRWENDSWQLRTLRSLMTTITATLGTAPVLLFHFGSVSVAGLVLNSLAIPFTGMALSAGLLTVATSGVPGLGAVFGQSADVFANLLVHTAGIGDRVLGWARIDVRVTSGFVIAGLAAGLAALAALPMPRLRWRLLLVACTLFGIDGWTRTIGHSASPHLDVVFLDVGQGDAALLQMPNGRYLLVDVGPRDDYFDAGRSVVVPHLSHFGIRRIDMALITHPHADHLGGLPFVLRNAHVDSVVHNGDEYDSALYRESMALIDSLGIGHRALRAGDEIRLDPRVRIYVLGPGAELASDRNTNERSVVLLVRFGQISLLFAGDAERSAEGALLRHFSKKLRADVIKVGHHGSRTSSRPEIVARTTSDVDEPIAVVSVARRNRFGLPDEDVLERWDAAGASLHLTSERGALWIRTDGRRTNVIRWRAD